MLLESNKIKKPWPTKAAMDQIYKQHLWGGKDFDFYSGEGSHSPEIYKSYIEAVIHFLTSFEKPLNLCDLGCGDFNIGKHFISYTNKYQAIDIVEDLIERNREMFEFSNLKFSCLDIAKDDLPKADVAIVRQVLQHLSNDEVHKILQKLKDFKYLILTEHIPNTNFTANKDIISGQGIRLKHKSGLDILASPFNFKVKEVKFLDKVLVNSEKELIVTHLYVLF